MRKREARWLGSFGIYDPAGSFGILSTLLPWWFKCDGVSRTVVQEGQLHFVDQKDAEVWIARYSQAASTVWSSDGLIIQWDIDGAREQINVDLWQLCVGGKKLVGLKGARDEALEIHAQDSSREARYECAKVSPAVPLETQKEWDAIWREKSNER